MKPAVPAAFIAGLTLALSLPALGQQFGRFRDVAPAMFYSDAVESLAEQNIIRGYDDGRFAPEEYMSRAHGAVLIKRYDEARVQPLWEQVARLSEELGLEFDDDSLDNDPRVEDGCMIGGCSGQLCVNEEDGDVVSTCEWREEYACYRDATCEKQDDGNCGWTETSSLRRCLNNPPSEGEPTNPCAAVLCPTNTRCVEGACIPLRGSSSSLSAQCKPHICPDGTRVPSCTPDGHVINYFADPCLTHQGSSSSRQQQAYCDAEHATFEEVVAENRSCTRDADCMLFERSCPYLTCGVAINRRGESTVAAAADDYFTCQSESGGPISCAGCIAQQVSCQQGRCVASSR